MTTPGYKERRGPGRKADDRVHLVTETFMLILVAGRNEEAAQYKKWSRNWFLLGFSLSEEPNSTRATEMVDVCKGAVY